MSRGLTVWAWYWQHLTGLSGCGVHPTLSTHSKPERKKGEEDKGHACAQHGNTEHPLNRVDLLGRPIFSSAGAGGIVLAL